MKILTAGEIIDRARLANGFFTIKKGGHALDKLRTTLKKMARDKDCPLNYYKEDDVRVFYKINDDCNSSKLDSNPKQVATNYQRKF